MTSTGVVAGMVSACRTVFFRIQPTESVVFFWMRDTRVPLDLCFLASDGRILEVLQMTPLDETLRPSSAPVALALELPAGVLAANGLGVGDRVVIPPGVTDGSE